MKELFERPFLREFLLPFIIPFIALGIQKFFGSTFSVHTWFLFYPTVFLMAWLGGIRGALISSLTSAIIVWWFIIPPTYHIVKETMSPYIVTVIFILFGYAFGIVHEKLKKANKELAKRSLDSETLLSHIVENSPDSIYVKDLKGRYLLANTGVGRILNINPDDIIGKDDSFIFPPETVAYMHEKNSAIMASGIIHNHLDTFMMSDGVKRFFNSTVGPLYDHNHTLIGLFGISRDITSLIEAQKALEASEKRYKAITEQNIAAVYVVQEGKLVYVNNAYAELLGYDSPRDIIGKEISAIVAPDEWNVVNDAVQKRLTGKTKEAHYETVLMRKDGSRLIVEAHGVMGEYDDNPAIIGMFIDKTIQKELENTMRQHNEEMQLIFDTSVTGIAIIDVEGNFLYANPTYCTMLGYTIEEIYTKNCVELSPINEQQRSREALLTAQKCGFVKDFTKKCETKKGDIIDVLVSFTRIGDAQKFVVMAQDVTNEIHYKEKLEAEIQQQTELNHQKDQLLIQQNRMIIMGEAINTLAHQWRQPLNLIAITIQTLYDDYEMQNGVIEPDVFEEMVTKITKEVQFLSSTIDRFRKLFSISKVSHSFTVQEVLDDIALVYTNYCEEKNIRFTITNDHQGMEMKLQGYKNEFQQILVNLITNAHEAIERHQILEGVIDVRAHKSDGYIVFTLHDNAGGIALEDRKKVFEPYFSTKSLNRTGLGLYMSKMIVEQQMGGKLSYNPLPSGSEFIIKIPLKDLE